MKFCPLNINLTLWSTV